MTAELPLGLLIQVVLCTLVHFSHTLATRGSQGYKKEGKSQLPGFKALVENVCVCLCVLTNTLTLLLVNLLLCGYNSVSNTYHQQTG